MSFRIEIVDPITGAATASRILRAAWTPPCLDYSAEYLEWQFTFPGVLEPKLVVGFLDDDALGCAAVTQRGFLLEGTHVDAYVLSFVAVDPVARGRGLAAAIYAGLLESISSEVPVIAFAEPNSVGEHLLINCVAAASFALHRLQPCRGVGYVRRTVPGIPTGCSAAPARDYEDFTSAIPRADNARLWSHPNMKQMVHYASDPRERVMMVIRDPEGVSIGSAMIVIAEIVSAQGRQRVPMLESVCLPSRSTDGLLAAFNFAADHYGSATILASNLSCLDNAVVRTSGARAMSSLFNSYVFFKSGRRGLENVSCLNLEVI
jgi:hypothetical protein